MKLKSKGYGLWCSRGLAEYLHSTDVMLQIKCHGVTLMVSESDGCGLPCGCSLTYGIVTVLLQCCHGVVTVLLQHLIALLEAGVDR
jgi:hypothetical protein